jgi:ABC-type Fe3+-hydroxamate transport system substrate-binding protein
MVKKRRAFLIMAIIFTFSISMLTACSSNKVDKTKSTITAETKTYSDVKGFLWELKKENPRFIYMAQYIWLKRICTH